ncbi:MAG TPA: hypothetical protein VM734_28830 [Kofleriaceae bacterium]|nr:hypothetical protein [Kofleriaceae bacterium]
MTAATATEAAAVPATAAAPRPTPHRIGMLFEILDEMGEDPRFTFELARVGAAAPIARDHVHHAEADGHGGLTRFLRAQGLEFVTPALRDGVAPSLVERARALVRLARHRGGPALTLHRTNPAWTRGARVEARASAGRLLSAEASARVFAAAKAAGASVSAYLLHGLTEAVVPLIAGPSASVTWGVPVNMRGPVRVEPDDANASSIMPVDVPRGAAPPAVHTALQQALAANLHWAKWDQLNLVARLGKRALRRKVSHYYRTADPARIGIFSNVGAWRGAGDDDVGILAYGVPVLTDPLFAGALSWNGKLAVTLRVHPCLTTDAAEVAGWLDAWIARLEPQA